MSYSPPPPPPPPGDYGQPSWGGAPRQHPSAVTALVLGILSWVCCGLLGIPAYVIGRRVEREVAASGGALAGDGLAKAGWILGLISLILMALAVLGIMALLAIGVLTDSTSGY